MRWIHEKGAARPFQTPKEKSKPKNASRFAKRIFWASPVYGSAEGVTLSQNFTASREVTPAAEQQIGEVRKMRLAKRLAFLGFDNSFGIIKGEQPLIRASRASKVAGAFLVLFWRAKENLALVQERSSLRRRRKDHSSVICSPSSSARISAPVAGRLRTR